MTALEGEINPDLCIGDGSCRPICPVPAIVQ
ncbi:MAG: 4Fe-4S binding protein [Deltaproteobacteria bacterium]|nr:4Fe-4S binding protein [Deltaproteobacteria bacterium]